MPTLIDVSRSPRGLIAASALVEAVAKVGDLAEKHYLEIKGPLDLSSKTTSAKIAKFILGAANRSVDKAATALDGCAVMIIGVSGHDIVGMPPLEMMEISKKVQPFLSAQGPAWDIVWVPIPEASNQVLVIVIEPPKPGQGPFICQRNGEGVVDGRVYVRGDGETREATAEELAALIDRGQVAASPDVDFDVRILGEVRRIDCDDEQTIEAYIKRTREYLIRALPSQQLPTPTTSNMFGLLAGLASSMPDYLQIPEDRTEEEYRQEIDDWEQLLRDVWPQAVKTLAGYKLSSPVVLISNRTSTFFHDVQLTIHLEGNVRAIRFLGTRHSIDLRDLGLPVPPRRWGPQHISPLAGIYSSHFQHSNYPTYQATPSKVRWHNSGSVDIVLDAGDIRPHATGHYDEKEFVLYTMTPNMESILGTWEITARGFNEVFAGEIEVVVGEELNMVPLFDDILNPKQTP